MSAPTSTTSRSASHGPQYRSGPGRGQHIGQERLRKGEQAMGRLADFLRPVIAARRAEPREGLLSGVVAAHERGDFLSEDEVLAATATEEILRYDGPIRAMAR